MDNKPYQFGFTVGLNTMDFKIVKSAKIYQQAMDSVDVIENVRRLGFNISLVSSLRISDALTFRFLPGLSFGQRNLEYSSYSPITKRVETHVMKLESTFIKFPVLIKYRARRLNNYRPYIIFGNSFNYDLASQKEIKEIEKPKIRLQPIDIYAEIGFGIDYYFIFFKLSTEIKFSMGLFDILKKDNSQYTQAIDEMHSRLIILSFHFE